MNQQSRSREKPELVYVAHVMIVIVEKRTFTTKLNLPELSGELSSSFSNLVIHLILILNDKLKSTPKKLQ